MFLLTAIAWPAHAANQSFLLTPAAWPTHGARSTTRLAPADSLLPTPTRGCCGANYGPKARCNETPHVNRSARRSILHVHGITQACFVARGVHVDTHVRTTNSTPAHRVTPAPVRGCPLQPSQECERYAGADQELETCSAGVVWRRWPAMSRSNQTSQTPNFLASLV